MRGNVEYNLQWFLNDVQLKQEYIYGAVTTSNLSETDIVNRTYDSQVIKHYISIFQSNDVIKISIISNYWFL